MVQMMETFVHEMLGPAIRRVGTVIGSSLAGAGVASDDVNLIVGGAIAFCGVIVDVTLRYFWARR